MTYEQIEKEFENTFKVNDIEIVDNNGKTLSVKSFLKQSFIKYLQADIERWTKVFDYHNDMSNERHSTMRNVARTEIQNLQAQIKEIEV